MLKEQIVSDEVLSTGMAEVVNTLNSRPLSRNSDRPHDEQAITPNHLLHMSSCPSLPPYVLQLQACLATSTLFSQPVLAQVDPRVLNYTFKEEKEP